MHPQLESSSFRRTPAHIVPSEFEDEPLVGGLRVQDSQESDYCDQTATSKAQEKFAPGEIIPHHVHRANHFDTLYPPGPLGTSIQPHYPTFVYGGRTGNSIVDDKQGLAENCQPAPEICFKCRTTG